MAPKRPENWLDAVERYRTSNLSLRQVAKEFGVTHPTVAAWVRRAGHEVKPSHSDNNGRA